MFRGASSLSSIHIDTNTYCIYIYMYIRIHILFTYAYTYCIYIYIFTHIIHTHITLNIYIYIYTYLEVASPHILAFWPSVLEPSQEPDPTTSITGSSSCRAGLPTWSIQDCAHLVAAANMMFSFDIFSRGVYISIHGIYIYIYIYKLIDIDPTIYVYVYGYVNTSAYLSYPILDTILSYFPVNLVPIYQ